MISPSEIDTVIHHNDMDGKAAAAVAWYFSEKHSRKEIRYIPVGYNDPIPEIEGKTIAILDLSLLPPLIMDLESRNKVIIIDHHKTSLKYKSLENYIIDIEFCGAYLAWKYFFPQKSVPDIIQYVNDHDLWKFLMPSSKEVMYSLNNINFDYDDLESFFTDFWRASLDMPKLIEDGRVLVSFIGKEVKSLCRRKFMVNIGGQEMWAVNSPVFRSEIGNELALVHPNVGAVFSRGEKEWNFSLRSPVGGVDVSAIASMFGGGGHHNAAGFSVTDLSTLGF